MSRPHILRLLRIAFSATCGIACLLLIALWVRSYRWADWIDRFDKTKIQTNIGSSSGTLIYSKLDWKIVPGSHVASHGWVYTVTKAFVPQKSHWIDWSNRPRSFRFAISHWLLIPLVAAIAAVPWMRWRFSLRTLLIATTLLAVVLGLVMAMR